MKSLSAALILATLVATPALAGHGKHHRHRTHAAHFSFAAPGQPYHISLLHNYGPGLTPDTFAYDDGPLARRCKQSAAAYRGQDGRAHPCF